jgi:hypothetical protein
MQHDSDIGPQKLNDRPGKKDTSKNNRSKFHWTCKWGVSERKKPWIDPEAIAACSSSAYEKS